MLHVLRNEYLNPFDSALDRNNLYHLSSGISVPDDIADKILSVIENGKAAFNEFEATRLQSTGNVPLHETIKRQKYASFSVTSNKVTVTKCGKQKTIESNRDVLGRLLATSTKHSLPIDFEKAFAYQLTAVPLSLAHPDGSRRTTNKSQLIDIVKSFSTGSCVMPSTDNVSAYIVDFIPLTRMVSVLPETFNKLFYVLLGKIPAGYKRIDIVVDA